MQLKVTSWFWLAESDKDLGRLKSLKTNPSGFSSNKKVGSLADTCETGIVFSPLCLKGEFDSWVISELMLDAHARVTTEDEEDKVAHGVVSGVLFDTKRRAGFIRADVACVKLGLALRTLLVCVSTVGTAPGGSWNIVLEPEDRACDCWTKWLSWRASEK